MDRQVLYANGNYVVVAVDRDGDKDQSVVSAYAVVTTSGAALRHEPTFDSARDWLDRLLLEDARADVPSPSKTSPRRRH